MERVRKLRAERGLTQVRLAVAADMNPATLNRIEQGKANPNIKTLERLASALDVGLVDLLEDDSPKAEPPLPFSPDEGGAQRRLAKVDELAAEYLMSRAEKHDAEVTDPNSPHFANATAATLWLAGVEDELAAWLDWVRELQWVTMPVGEDFGAAVATVVERFLAALGAVLAFDQLTNRAEERIKAMNDTPDELAARRLAVSTAAAEASRKRLEDQREAASG